jgi:peptide/nickel transport system substrate-binding protein
MTMDLTRRSALQLFGATAGLGIVGLPTLTQAQDGTKVLVVALDEIAKQLDPLLYQTNPGYRIMQNIYDSLLTVDYGGDGALQPALAESWTRVDGKTLDLTLREGVTFHDGSPLTAGDVEFSFGTLRRTDEASPGYGTAQQFLSTIESVVAVDDRTIRVTSSVTDPVLELRLTAWGSQIVSKAAFEAAGGFEGFAIAPVGTGPYRLASFSADTIELEAFDGYWGGRPAIDRIVYRAAPELSSRIAGLASGDFDLIGDVPADQFTAVTDNADLEIVGGPIASMRVIKFDTRNEALKDPRVRRALGLAIDRQAIVDALWGGLVSVPNGHQLPSFGALYEPSRAVPEYNPDEARRLLEDAGYDGTVIPYRIRAAAYGPELATAQVVVSMWEAVGVKTDLQIKENFGQMLEYPGTGMRNGVDPILVNDPLFGLWRSYNRSEGEVWSNEEFYKQGDVLETSLDPAERRAAFQTMLDIFEEDPPAIILHTMGVFYGKRKAVNWTPYPSVYIDFRKADIG